MHPFGDGAGTEGKNKIIFAIGSTGFYIDEVPLNEIALEDELGDVLEKALRQAALTEAELAKRADVDAGRLREAIDYRSQLTMAELRSLARVLALNEVGLCALGQGKYPLPRTPSLPFVVWPLRMRHGIGVANAYLVAEHERAGALLFDVGPNLTAIEREWPQAVCRVDAVFLTHVEAEHAGALCEVVERFGGADAYVPSGANAPCGRSMSEGETKQFGALEVTAFSTPGHVSAHNCYLVASRPTSVAPPMLIAGDLIFAGSAGGGYFCCRQLQKHLRRVLAAVPPETVIAPGHGPLTTAENELRYNPFLG